MKCALVRSTGGATELYETFCVAMARGKLEQSGERHEVIEESAHILAED
jgi:hypothetical protein